MKSLPVTLSGLIDFYAQNNDLHEDDKVIDLISKEGNNKPTRGVVIRVRILKTKSRFHPNLCFSYYERMPPISCPEKVIVLND